MLPPVPTDTRQLQTTMLYDLIEKSNPGFKVSYPPGSVVFGVPSAITLNPDDPYKNDTTVRVTPAPNTTGMGVVSVNYRRVDVGTLFRGMTLKLTDWYSGNPMPVATWLPLVVAKYGLSLTTADLNDTSGSNAIANTSYANMLIKSTSLCYKGTVRVYWTKGLQPLDSLFTQTTRALVGRLYPGGNDFTTPGRKPQGEFLTFCQDATSIAATLETLPASGSSYSDAQKQAIVDFLLANTSRTDWNIGSAGAGSGGIAGSTWFKYSLPNAAIPEANSAKFNRCIVIPGWAASWFAGKLILHYNV